MDYGSFLKQTVGNQNQRSKSYAKQSQFAGSKRQIRGQVLRVLAPRPMKRTDVQTMISDERLPEVLQDLEREGLIRTLNTGDLSL